MTTHVPIRRLAVIGLGLIGGSFARALRAGGAVGTIAGFDSDPEQLRQAHALGVIDFVSASAAEAVRGADVVAVAVPVLATAAALRDCAAAIGPKTIITEVGSTKRSVLQAATEVFGSVPARFVPGHPIAGTEKSGVANAQADLFRGHRVVLTPHPAQDAEALEVVTQLWQRCGARVVTMEPARHDAIFAATSHLPHLIAYSFVDMLAHLPGADSDVFPNAGGGFRDFTRIASSSPRMWHDILRANAEPVAALLRKQIAELQGMLGMIEKGNWESLQAVFESARATRERYLSKIE